MFSPFEVQLGFGKLIEGYKEDPKRSAWLESLNSQHIKTLSSGIQTEEEYNKYKETINKLIDPLFPEALSANEIKSLTWPMRQDKIIRCSQRFENTVNSADLEDAQTAYNLTDEEFYILHCTFILAFHYQYPVSLSGNLFYKKIDQQGLQKTYRILMNGDFVKIFPKQEPKVIEQSDLSLLLNNPKDIDLWKSYFPERSWIVNGFLITNLFDASKEQALTEFKDLLITAPEDRFAFDKDINDVFLSKLRSYYGIPDLMVGVKFYMPDTKSFDKLLSYSFGPSTHALLQDDVCSKDFCDYSGAKVFDDHEVFVSSNIDLEDIPYEERPKYFTALYEDGVRSYLAAPVKKGNEMVGLLEIGSSQPYAINNLTKLHLQKILPITTSRIIAIRESTKINIKAQVQKEFTSIHPSVEWKFVDSIKAKNDPTRNEVGISEDIVFKGVHALYGQSDIVGSSNLRNEAIISDLRHQLKQLITLLEGAYILEQMPIVDKVVYKLNKFVFELETRLDAGLEQEILGYIHHDVEPLLNILKERNKELEEDIEAYFQSLDGNLNFYYSARKNYTESVDSLNRLLARHIDKKQVEAQKIYPHFFERYKTDGVEHNIYLGDSITPKTTFSEVYLDNLRLWQLVTMAESHQILERESGNMRHKLAIASLVLVYSNTLDIRYRSDEKRFDVDGAYNARYEILKKRIDKSLIKNTNERLTQAGKIVIVFAQGDEQNAYLSMLNYMQEKELIENDIERLEIEDLQGVTGLRALRVTVKEPLPPKINGKTKSAMKQTTKAVAVAGS